MSFFNRLSNLVSGVANSMLDNIEKSNPVMMHEQNIRRQQANINELKKAERLLQKVYAATEIEHKHAGPKEAQTLALELADIEKQLKHTQDQLSKAESKLKESKRTPPLPTQSSTAEDALARVRSRLETQSTAKQSLQHKPPSDSQNKIASSKSKDGEPKITTPKTSSTPKKRTL